jgi:hypothetical protein
MKVRIAITAVFTSILTIAGNAQAQNVVFVPEANLQTNEYCTVGDVTAGAVYGLVAGVVIGATWEVAAMRGGSKVLLKEAVEINGQDIERFFVTRGTDIDNVMSKLGVTNYAVSPTVAAEVPGRLVAGTAYLGALGGGIIGAGTGALAGCVARPLYEDSWAQAAVETTTDYALIGIGATVDAVDAGWSWTKETVTGLWNQPVWERVEEDVSKGLPEATVN